MLESSIRCHEEREARVYGWLFRIWSMISKHLYTVAASTIQTRLRFRVYTFFAWLLTAHLSARARSRAHKKARSQQIDAITAAAEDGLLPFEFDADSKSNSDATVAPSDSVTPDGTAATASVRSSGNRVARKTEKKTRAALNQDHTA